MSALCDLLDTESARGHHWLSTLVWVLEASGTHASGRAVTVTVATALDVPADEEGDGCRT